MADFKDLRFPLDIGTESLFKDNIIQFSIHDFAAGGYNKPDANTESASKPTTVLKPKGKLTHKIYLPITSAPNSKYSANWTLGSPNVVVNTAIDVLENPSIGSAWDGLKGVLSSNSMQWLRGKMEKNQGLSDSIKSGGVFVQPYQENLFQGIGFREFGFGFKLIPRNEKELKECAKIVSAFKRSVVPSMVDAESTGTRIFNSPSVFYIKYIIVGKQGSETEEYSDGGDYSKNEWLPKFHPCICKQVDVTYGGDAKNYVSFADTGGAPVFYDIKLAFTELTYVTRENIDKGY